MSLHFQSIQIARVPVTNRRPFRVSTHFTAAFNAIICRIEIDGTYGYGAGGHCRLTGETEENIFEVLRNFSPRLENRKFANREELLNFIADSLPQNHAAAAALDIAVWDWDARAKKLPLYQLLSREFKTSPRHEVETDMTIGLESPEETLELARAYIGQGFTKLKIKVGHPLPAQLELIQKLRAAVGETIELTADANQGYSVEEAIALANALGKARFLLLEQPVKKEDLAGLGEVARQSTLPIFADEGAATFEQIREIGKNRLTHGIVLKLFKYGGLTPTLRALSYAQEYGLATMIGCYSDTTLSLAAALHLALAFPEIGHIDLDSHLLMEKDPFDVFITQENRLLPTSIGLGETSRLKSFFE